MVNIWIIYFLGMWVEFRKKWGDQHSFCDGFLWNNADQERGTSNLWLSLLAMAPSCQERTKDVHMLRVTKERCISGGPKETWIVSGCLSNPSEHRPGGRAAQQTSVFFFKFLNYWHPFWGCIQYYSISISACVTYKIQYVDSEHLIKIYPLII